MEGETKKSIIEEITAELEDLESQLKKGGEEIKSTFKEKKAKIAALIRQYATEIEGLGHDKMDDLRDRTGDLLNLLESDFDFSYTDYEDDSHQISKETLETKKAETGEKLDKFSDEISISFQHLRQAFKNLW